VISQQLSQNGNDKKELKPALKNIEKNTGSFPAKLSRGKIKMDRITKLIDLAKNSIGVTHGIEAALLEKEYILEEIKKIKAKLRYIDKRLKYYLDKIDCSSYLLSIPGVGIVTAASFLGEIGNISKYRSSKKIIKLAGLNLIEISSGIKKGVKKISKRGNSNLRFALYQCALVAIAKNAQIKKYFEYQTKTKNKMKTVIAVQCKLARIMFALCKYKRYYEPLELYKYVFAEEVA
jgi:transposase